MKIAIIGTGYVGLVTGVGLADFGWDVTCVDIDKKKIEELKKRKMPFYESGLEPLVKKNLKENRLSFTDSINNAIKNSDVIFIAVGTPSKNDGSTDLTQVYDAAKMVANSLNGYKLVVLKSTVPMGTTRKIYKFIQEVSHNKNNFDIAFNPEFLREGSAVHDFFHPDRVIVGDGSLKEELKGITERLGILESVEFLGVRKDVSDLMNKSKIFVLPSRWEGLPMVILEAMALGMPIVATKVGGIPEVIENGKDDLLVQPEHSEELTNAILRLLDDSKLRGLISSNAYRKIKEDYSIEKYTENLLNLYSELAR
jgi:hypothetical protein